MVKWKKSTLLTKLVFNKGGFVKLRTRIYGKPKKAFKPKKPKAQKPLSPPKIPHFKQGTMRMVQREPELHYNQGFHPRETGVYAKKRRWF